MLLHKPQNDILECLGLFLNRCSETLLLVANFLPFCIEMSLASHARPLYLFFNVLTGVCGIYKLGQVLSDSTEVWIILPLNYCMIILILLRLTCCELLNLLEEKICIRLIANLNSTSNFFGALILNYLKENILSWLSCLVYLCHVAIAWLTSLLNISWEDQSMQHRICPLLNPFDWRTEYIKYWW